MSFYTKCSLPKSWCNCCFNAGMTGTISIQHMFIIHDDPKNQILLNFYTHKPEAQAKPLRLRNTL